MGKIKGVKFFLDDIILYAQNEATLVQLLGRLLNKIKYGNHSN